VLGGIGEACRRWRIGARWPVSWPRPDDAQLAGRVAAVLDAVDDGDLHLERGGAERGEPVAQAGRDRGLVGSAAVLARKAARTRSRGWS
jgi:hypothetical protein